MSTLFTKIIDGQIPGRFVWADPLSVGFLSIAPIAAGHTLVVPRQEIDRFTAADDPLLAQLAAVAARIGRAQEHAWPGTRATLLVAGFEVPHLHWHVVAVGSEAQLSFAAAKQQVPDAELDEAARRLREALATTGQAAHVPASAHSPAL
jgi:diadenosine tetraphosphate (Ap4A) HIT family hydrolase